jgi:release factor glutamine methyltransferase
MNPIWTIKKILLWTQEYLSNQKVTESPSLDAQILLAHTLNVDKVYLFTHYDKPLSPDETKHYKELIKRRLKGEPIAYIVGFKNWYGLDIKVTTDVLIPRPETETLIDISIAMLQILEHPKRVYDLFTGSGCIGLAIAKKYPHLEIISVDKSSKALEIAKENASHLNLDHIIFEEKDLSLVESYDELSKKYGKADLVLSNPPYLSQEEWKYISLGIQEYEPYEALVSGELGTELSRTLLDQKEKILDSGFLLMESSLTQLQSLKLDKISQFYWQNVTNLPTGYSLIEDMSYSPRFLCWRTFVEQR